MMNNLINKSMNIENKFVFSRKMFDNYNSNYNIEVRSTFLLINFNYFSVKDQKENSLSEEIESLRLRLKTLEDEKIARESELTSLRQLEKLTATEQNEYEQKIQSFENTITNLTSELESLKVELTNRG